MQLNHIENRDCYQGLDTLAAEWADCCVTSPPYFALRDYNVPATQWPAVSYKLHGFEIHIPEMECCLGLEPTPEAFVGHLVAIFRKVYRVLKPEGTLWINIGDSYWGGKGKSGQSYSGDYQQKRKEEGKSFNGSYHQIGGKSKTRPVDGKHPEIKPKDLVGIPWMLAFALRADGWYLRQDIIWSKPNPMPESVTDRCTKSHEYIFLLSKSEKYYYDHQAIMQPVVTEENRPGGAARNRIYNYDSKDNNNPQGYFKKSGNLQRKKRPDAPENNGKNQMGSVPWESDMANKRSVWTVSLKPYSGKHHATFPERLIMDCIKAGCPPKGLVLDIFGGANTTGLVCRKLDRNFFCFEINPDSVKEAQDRISRELGMFA